MPNAVSVALIYPCSEAELPPGLVEALRAGGTQPFVEHEDARLAAWSPHGEPGTLLLRVGALPAAAWESLPGVVAMFHGDGWTILALIPAADPATADLLTDRLLALGVDDVCPEGPFWTLLRHRITRYRGERLRQTQLENLARAVDVAPYGLTITDALTPDNPIIYANEGFMRVTGYPIEEILGRNCRFLQRDLVNQAAVATLRQAVRTGESCQTTLVNFRRDGEAFNNELTLTPLRDKNGRVTNFVGVQYDVTVHAAALLTSQENEERFRNLVDLLPTRIWTTDTDLRFNFLNKAWRDFLPPGSAPAEADDARLRGERGWMDWVHPEDQATASEAIARARETRRPLGFEARLLRPDGEARQFSIEGVPRLDANGLWLGLLGSATDVTESRTAQDMMGRRLRQLSMQSMLLRRMMTSTDDPAGAVDGVLSMLGEMAGASALHLLEFTDTRATLTEVARWDVGNGDPGATVAASPFEGRRLTELMPFSGGALLEVAEPVIVRQSELRRFNDFVGVVVIAPMRRNGATVGVMAVLGREKGEEWGTASVDLLRDVAPALPSLLAMRRTGQR